jgi:plastocyanin
MARRLRMAVAGLVAAASLIAAGCGADEATTGRTSTQPASSAQAAPTSAVTIDVASFKYRPQSVTVAAGGSVTWVNRDKAGHNAENATVTGPAKFDTGRLELGERKRVEFSKPGVYPYYCIYHRFMEATVTVK